LTLRVLATPIDFSSKNEEYPPSSPAEGQANRNTNTLGMPPTEIKENLYNTKNEICMHRVYPCTSEVETPTPRAESVWTYGVASVSGAQAEGPLHKTGIFCLAEV
jgi:hypothetical protein